MTKSTPFYLITSGAKPRMKRRFIGLIGKNCVKIRRREAWDSKIYRLSIWQCWLSKHGGLFIMNNHYSIGCTRRGIFLTFLMAKLGSIPSTVSRSLLAARDVVREGSTWQIGDGSRIGVTTYKWLPNAPAFLHEPNAKMKVCELIDQSSRQWDRGKLATTFTPRTCKQILSLPLNQLDSHDTLV